VPLSSAMGARSGLLQYDEWLSGQREKHQQEAKEWPTEEELTPEEQDQFEILQFCSRMYEDARRAREPYETFDVAWDLYVSNMWPNKWPTWRSKISVNKVRSIICFIQAVMTDNKPRISVEPEVPGSEDAADLLRKLVDRDWDNNDMQGKNSIFVLFGLIWGTGFMKVLFDPYADGGRGKHVAIPVAPYKIFTNATATSIEDCEYLIHADSQTMGWIRRNFPDKAKACYAVRTIRMASGSEADRDFIREGDAAGERKRIVTAQSINGNVTAPLYSNATSPYREDDGDVVEVIEYWMRDDTLEEYQKQKVVNGQPQFEPVVGPDGMYDLELAGMRTEVSEIDGQPFPFPFYKPKMQPVMETCWRPKYPNGRLVITAGCNRVLLRDIANPFQTDGFPWAMWKDYDNGAFWGQGECISLKDCAIAENRILSQVYDILEKIGSPSYKLDKNAGVNAASIKNKPGLVIPMEKMDGLQPLDKPGIPKEFFELYEVLDKAMGQVSGVNDAVSGHMPAGNTAFATMDQLQESGAAPIRLKVRNFESGLSRIGKLRVQLIQQFDRGDRPIRERQDKIHYAQTFDEQGQPVVQPVSNVETKFRTYQATDLQGAVEFAIEPVSSLSTSPAGLWNKWMQLYDKKLVDMVWWHEKNRIEGYRTQVPRMLQQQAANQAMEAMAKRASKVGGKPGPEQSRPQNHPKVQTQNAPPSNIPSRHQNAAVR
jgi:hypothetical protein